MLCGTCALGWRAGGPQVLGIGETRAKLAFIAEGPGLTEVGLALVMLLCLLLLPRGLTRGLEIVWPFAKWSTRRPVVVANRPAPAEDVAAPTAS